MPMPKVSQVNCSRGAPMGRLSYAEVEDPEEFCQRVHLQRLPMIGYGDYDQGGAYWGSCKHGWMYRAYYFDPKSEAEDSVDLYLRATSRQKAKELVQERLPKARFYR